MEFQIKLLVMSKVAEGNIERERERARPGEVNTAYKLYRVWSTRNVSFGKISRKYAIPETFTRLLISRYENCTRIIRTTRYQPYGPI